MNFLGASKIVAPLSGGFTLTCQGGTGDFIVTEFKVYDNRVEEVITSDGAITPPPRVVVAALTKLKKEVLIEFLTRNGLSSLARLITEDKEVTFNAQGQFDSTFSQVALDDIKFDITDPNFKALVVVTAELNATYAGASPNPIQYSPAP